MKDKFIEVLKRYLVLEEGYFEDYYMDLTNRDVLTLLDRGIEISKEEYDILYNFMYGDDEE